MKPGSHNTTKSRALISIDEACRRSDANQGAEYLSFVQKKNSRSNPKRIEIPILPQLRDVINRSPCGDLIYLVTEHGKPFSINGFGNKFRDWCDEAGLYHCTSHGIRKASATILAERGATAPQLKAIFGWSKLETAESYIAKADKKTLSRMGLQLMVSEQTESKIIPLSGHAANGGTNRGKKL